MFQIQHLGTASQPFFHNRFPACLAEEQALARTFLTHSRANRKTQHGPAMALFHGQMPRLFLLVPLCSAWGFLRKALLHNMLFLLQIQSWHDPCITTEQQRRSVPGAGNI
jgi:hypothetical protein